MRKTIFTFFFLMIYFYAKGQIMIARNVDIDPFLEKIEKDRRILGTTYFSAEAGSGFFSTEGEQAWNIKFQAHIEIYR